MGRKRNLLSHVIPASLFVLKFLGQSDSGVQTLSNRLRHTQRVFNLVATARVFVMNVRLWHTTQLLMLIVVLLNELAPTRFASAPRLARLLPEALLLLLI